MMTHKAHLTIVHLYSQEGNAMGITTNPVYSHPETGETPVYYRSQCSVSVSVQELGEGDIQLYRIHLSWLNKRSLQGDWDNG